MVSFCETHRLPGTVQNKDYCIAELTSVLSDALFGAAVGVDKTPLAAALCERVSVTSVMSLSNAMLHCDGNC